MLPRHLIIFAKAPRQGAAKTRLSAELGRTAACQISRIIAFSLIKRLSNDTRWNCLLAVTPDKFARVGRFWPATARRCPQGNGTLGLRMSRPINDLPPGPLVIVGSDVPGIKQTHIANAFHALGKSHFVFGPARDGGYWLIGMRRRPTILAPFSNVVWSSPSALADTLQNIDKRYNVTLLEELEDIDDLASWRRWQKHNPMQGQTTSLSLHKDAA